MSLRPRRPRLLLAGLLSLSLAGSACGTDDDEPAARTQPEPKVPPTWETSELRSSWHAPGFAENFGALAAADLDGDGDEELLYGGRGLAAWDPQDGRLLWSFRSPSAGDDSWITEIRAIASTSGDETPELLVSDAENDLHLIDGATGEAIWSRAVDSFLYTTTFALVDADGDEVPDVFPAYGSRAYAGASGDELWRVSLPREANFVAQADLDGDERLDLLLGLQPPSVIGDAEPMDWDQLYGIAADGTELFRFTPEVGRVFHVVAADLEGDGTDEAIFVTELGDVYAVDADGSELWRTHVFEGDFDFTVVADADGDGREELFVAGTDWVKGFSAVRLEADGSVAWTAVLADKVYALQPAGDVLLVGSGDELPWQMRGRITGLGIATGAERWSVETERSVRELALVRRAGRTDVVLGQNDGIVRALDPATGARRWDWATGGFVVAVATGDLDADGVDEIVRADEFGHVTAYGADGARRWSWRPDVGNGGWATGLAVGDLDGDGSPEVVATGERVGEVEMGIVAALAADGSTLLWSTRVDGAAHDPRIADLDGDGRAEVIVGERSVYTCSVRALEASGATRWSRETNVCELPQLSIGDVDADGLPEIAFGGQDVVALLGADGGIRWLEEVAMTFWISLRPDGFFHGGSLAGDAGHVTRRDVASGAAIHATRLEPSPSDVEGAPFAGTSRYAADVPDTNGDGLAELAVSSNNGAVYLLDPTSGSALWETRLEPTGLFSGDAHHAGPLAWVPGTDAGPGYLAVAQTTYVHSTGAIFALGLDGTIHGSAPMTGEGRGIEVATTAQGKAAVVGAGLGLYVIEAAARQ